MNSKVSHALFLQHFLCVDVCVYYFIGVVRSSTVCSSFASERLDGAFLYYVNSASGRSSGFK